MAKERLQKILSRAGIASRRQAENYIKQGKVSVNGQVVTQLGLQADPQKDKILVNGKRITLKQAHRYYCYYKPRGLVVSKSDELGRKGVFDFLNLPPEVNAVGRLDKESEGLLLLSDDGDFVYRYTHPKFEVAKVYQVQLSRVLKKEEVALLLKGLPLEGRPAPLKGVKNVSRSRFKKKSQEVWVELELIEGRKREIRCLMEQLGIEVKRLIRVRHGKFALGSLKAGEFEECPLPVLGRF